MIYLFDILENSIQAKKINYRYISTHLNMSSFKFKLFKILVVYLSYGS